MARYHPSAFDPITLSGKGATMMTFRIRTDQDPRDELLQIELDMREHEEILLGERPVFDLDGHVREGVIELVYSDPSLEDAELRRLGFMSMAEFSLDPSPSDEPF